MPAQPSLRSSPIAGTWYPGNRNELAAAVQAYMDRAELPELPGKLVAVIAPHAGYDFSGPVAGYAFAALRAAAQGVDLVAVISPMHQAYTQPILTTAHDAYLTPLGEVPVDRDSLAALDALIRPRLGFGITAVSRDQEHSLEIELPFLQSALPDGFRLLPVMLRSQSPQVAQVLGEALAELLKPQRALLVASTDLSHFYDQAAAQFLDAEMMHCFESFDPQAIFELERSGRGQACGHAAVAAVLWAAKALGADTVRLLRYATSGDMTGEFDRVVGYGAAAVLKSDPSA